MKMINVENKRALQAAITTIQEGAKARLINVDDVLYSVASIERLLSERLKKKDWTGLSFWVNIYADEYVGASRYPAPRATLFKLQRRATGWFVVELERNRIRGNAVVPIGLQSKTAELAEFAASATVWKRAA